MLLRYECKNIAGLLLQKEKKSVTQIWKVDLPQGKITRHTIYVMDQGNPVILQEYKSAEMRDMVHKSIVHDMRKGTADLLVVPYLYCYKHLSDDAAFAVLKHMNYNGNFLNIAIHVAKEKCREWSKTGNKVIFNLDLIRHEDPVIEAYQHGWGLKVPYEVVMKGINPYQFYRFILNR